MPEEITKEEVKYKKSKLTNIDRYEYATNSDFCLLRLIYTSEKNRYSFINLQYSLFSKQISNIYHCERIVDHNNFCGMFPELTDLYAYLKSEDFINSLFSI